VQEIVSLLQVRASYLASGVAALAAIAIVFALGLNAVCNLSMFAVPLFWMVHSSAADKACAAFSELWTNYWLVYAALILLESFINAFDYWVYAYPVVKFLFLTWCCLPSTRGAVTLCKFVFETAWCAGFATCFSAPCPSTGPLDKLATTVTSAFDPPMIAYADESKSALISQPDSPRLVAPAEGVTTLSSSSLEQVVDSSATAVEAETANDTAS